MTGYILKRLLSAIPVLLGISVIVFVIMAMIPGDPATAILGSYATPENVEKLNRDLGLDVSVRSDRSYRAFHGNRSLMRLILWSGIRASVSANHACGSTPFSLAVSIRV